MKSASAALIALLNAQEFLMADLYTITLASGTVLRYTSGDGNLVVGGQTFSSVGPFLTRQGTKTVVGIQVDTLQVVFATGTSPTINGITFAQFAATGGFDGARLKLERVFMPIGAYGDTSAGTLIQFVGRIAEVDTTRVGVTLNVNSDLEILDIQIPRNLFQAPCRFKLYDAGCTLSAASFKSSSSAAAGSTKMKINSALANAAGYFNLGTLVFTSGQNTGQTRTVKSYSVGVHYLAQPLPYTPSVADTFDTYPGCDHLQATCLGKFNNLANYGGMPYIPAPETAY